MTDFEDTWPLIEALAAGQWVSGTALAQQLGISREALSRRMRKLQEQFALPVQSQVGRGYRLSQALELLDPQSLHAALQPQLQTEQISVLRSTDSTNRQLQQQTQWRLCLAEHQSSGRGRRGRQWHSPVAQNLYLSIRQELDFWPSRLPALGLVLGVALCRMLNQSHQIPMRLKWPNDLYLNGKKCGGMLIEQRGEIQSGCELIIGLGLNVHMQEADIDQQWTSLKAEGYLLSRNQIAADVSDSLLQELSQISDTRIQNTLQSFSEFDAFANQNVTLQSNEEALHGIALGVDDWGRLRLNTPLGEQLISVGDISLRRQT